MHRGVGSIEEDQGDVEIVVDAATRGQGVGRALLNDLVTAPELAGLTVVRADVRVDNPAARRMVEAAGWQLAAEGDPDDPESHTGFEWR